MNEACPKCGGTQGFTYKIQVSGTADYMGGWGVDSRAGDEMLNNDDTRYRDPKTVICLDCDKRVPMPKRAP